MTIWAHADIARVTRNEWRAWIREFDLFANGSTLEETKREVYRLLEETQGEHNFSVIFTTC